VPHHHALANGPSQVDSLLLLSLQGFSGFNSTSAKLIAPALFPRGAGKQVHFMTVLFGTNDASAQQGKGVELLQYRDNMLDLLVYLLDVYGVPENRLLVLCPPPVNDAVSTFRKASFLVIFHLIASN